MSEYSASNWFWSVAEATDRVYSSARAAYVPVADATYQAWLEEGETPTVIASEAELRDVLREQYPAGWAATPPTPAEQAVAALGAGLTITSPTLGVTAIPFDVGPDTQNHITAEVTSILLDGTFVGGASTIAWPDLIIPYPAQHLWTVDQFKVFARAQGAYVAALYKVINGTATTLPPASVTLA